MGMYTELVLGVAFRKSTPQNIISIIEAMVTDDRDVKTTNHELFSTERWRYMLRCDSYYFDGRTNVIFEKDDINHKWHLTVRCNLKNYDSEIEYFLHFIDPYLETTGFLGYMRYEEFDYPTLIFKDYSGIFLNKLNVSRNDEIPLDKEYLDKYCKI